MKNVKKMSLLGEKSVNFVHFDENFATFTKIFLHFPQFLCFFNKNNEICAKKCKFFDKNSKKWGNFQENVDKKCTFG